MGEDYDYSSWDGNKWEVEMTALYNVSGTMATKNANDEDVINVNTFGKSGTQEEILSEFELDISSIIIKIKRPYQNRHSPNI